LLKEAGSLQDMVDSVRVKASRKWRVLSWLDHSNNGGVRSEMAGVAIKVTG